MKERLFTLRKTLKLTQAEFAEKINLKRAAITAYETGVNNIPERVVLDICRTFNVNEQWLRDGDDPMFRPVKSLNNELASEVGALIAGEDDFTKKLILRYLQLPEEEKKLFEKFIRSLDQ